MKKIFVITAALLLPIAAQAITVSYIAFFDWGRTELLLPARQIVSEAAKMYKLRTDVRLMSVGHADTSEPDAAELSLRRANAVRDALVRERVPAEAITAVGRGAEHPLVPTAAGVREPQNRRVEIQFQEKR
jgi:outer membrane protein OmpA-like peptidoglycan-associated protein